MAKQVILRFPAKVVDDLKGIGVDMKAFSAWSWTGDEELPASCEIEGYSVGGGGPMAPVRYSQDDADACLAMMKLATRIFVVDYEAAARDKARRAAEKRRAADFMPAPKPAEREQVPPSLRFLLCNEARAEAHRYYRETELLGPIGLIATADQLNERYPYMARVDDLLGGAIRQCLRRGAELQPPAGGPYPWHWCGISIANGNPQGTANQIASAMEKMASFPRRGERSAASFDDPDGLDAA